MTAPWFKRVDRSVVGVICFVLPLLASSCRASAEEFSDAIHAYLQHRVEAEQLNAGIVVGIVDPHGSTIVSYGKLDHEADQQVNGDTLFEIGSATKTFTALLLQDMIERGEMALDDPVAQYLPNSVKVPTRSGKQITLRHLATHTSGLPNVPDNLEPRRADNLYADYTVEQMYAFLSGYKLPRDSGAQSAYSNLGMGLLGHVIALKAGASYESLVVDRICRPLKMDNTRITLTPELKARFATGHNQFGEAMPSWDLPTLAGAGALRSTASDMLKFVSANLGLTPSTLTPLMEKTHDDELAWFVTRDLQGTAIINHDGGTAGHTAFLSFDKARHRGVVVLVNARGAFDSNIGTYLLQCEWQSERRPTEGTVNPEIYDAYVGQYQHSNGSASGLLMLRRFLDSPSCAPMYVSAGLCLAVVIVLRRRAGRFRRRWLIQSGVVVGLLAGLAVLAFSRGVDAPSQYGIGIRREGDRLFAQATGAWPVDEWGAPRIPVLPPVIAELWPESNTRFFERLSGMPITFSLDARGRATSFTAHHLGTAFSFHKTSGQPPTAPEPIKPRVSIKLDPELLDAYVGDYEFPPDAGAGFPGMKLTIWREGNQLVAQASGPDAVQGPFEIYPESESRFFFTISSASLIFIRNDRGEVTAVIHHEPPLPDIEGSRSGSAGQ